MSSHCPRQRTHLACKARSSISRKAVPVLGHSIFAGRSACFGEHWSDASTERSDPSSPIWRCWHESGGFFSCPILSKLIILFAMFNLIFPLASEPERAQLSPCGCRIPSRASCRPWYRYRERDRTRCFAPHLPRWGSASRSFQHSRC